MIPNVSLARLCRFLPTALVLSALVSCGGSGDNRTRVDPDAAADGSGGGDVDPGDAADTAETGDVAPDVDASIDGSGDTADVADVPDAIDAVDGSGDATDASDGSGDVSDVLDADTGDLVETGDVSLNSCGGTTALEFDGEPAEPGAACGCGGTLLCDGTELLLCSGGDPVDACGGCSGIEGAVGDTCGVCAGGLLACDAEGALVCEGAESGVNACTGCALLPGEPGAVCTDETGPGIYLCATPDTLACVGGDDKACGGTAELVAVPGQACGVCGGGLYVCDGIDALTCVGGDAGVNDCDGCAPLEGTPGDACGACGGAWACDTEFDRVVCADEPRNDCGGCAILGGVPGVLQAG